MSQSEDRCGTDTLVCASSRRDSRLQALSDARLRPGTDKSVCATLVPGLRRQARLELRSQAVAEPWATSAAGRAGLVVVGLYTARTSCGRCFFTISRRSPAASGLGMQSSTLKRDCASWRYVRSP